MKYFMGLLFFGFMDKVLISCSFFLFFRLNLKVWTGNLALVCFHIPPCWNTLVSPTARSPRKKINFIWKHYVKLMRERDCRLIILIVTLPQYQIEEERWRKSIILTVRVTGVSRNLIIHDLSNVPQPTAKDAYMHVI